MTVARLVPTDAASDVIEPKTEVAPVARDVATEPTADVATPRPEVTSEMMLPTCALVRVRRRGVRARWRYCILMGLGVGVGW